MCAHTHIHHVKGVSFVDYKTVFSFGRCVFWDNIFASGAKFYEIESVWSKNFTAISNESNAYQLTVEVDRMTNCYKYASIDIFTDEPPVFGYPDYSDFFIRYGLYMCIRNG